MTAKAEQDRQQAHRRLPILVPNETCWRIEGADRLALIVDAADYFATVKQAMLAARHSIIMIGWDFDTRIALEPGGATIEGPNRLGRFLTWLARRRPELDIYLLKWRLGVLKSIGRGTTPLFILDWLTSRNIHFRLDGMHPPGAAHHQKIVVIDDAIAFCGGIDMTLDRWDTRAHRDGDPCRIRPGGAPCGPWHDATTAIDGAAARALGDLSRERWKAATGQALPRPPAGAAAWPAGLAPTMRDVAVGIARTWPEREGAAAIFEIEALYIAAIAAARRCIYIETQYFASRGIAEAIIARLGENDPPEIVLVLPQSADGWLEVKAMDSARTRLLRLVRRADRHGRFRAFYPVTEQGEPIYVHAKITVVDDTLLRVGSSNLNNRSLGFDTECDLAVEADPSAPGDRDLRQQIAAVRNDLLAEHLGRDATTVAAAIAETGSLIAALGRLDPGTGRRLVDLPSGDNDLVDEALAEGELVDPERPQQVRRLWRRLLPFG